MTPTNPPSEPADPLAADVLAVGQIEAVPKILEVVCRTTGMGFSAVARVTDARWVACAIRDEIAFGLRPGGELEVGTTICDEIRQSGKLVVIDDVEADDHFRCHPTPKRYGFRSYISVPIHLPDGSFFGTLCAIDPRPVGVNKVETVEMFHLFASLIGMHLESRRRLAAAERALLDERETAQLREQFIAVLGHDLRSPLVAIRTGAALLSLLPKGEKADRTLAMIDRSVGRMTEMIDTVADFARGRLGGGLSFDRRVCDDLEGVLNQVVSELETAHVGRAVDRDVRIDRPVACDGARLAQLLANLLSNALTHGDPAGPVRVRADTPPGAFRLSVTNRGPAIPPEVVGRLFEPFVRGAVQPAAKGLGLGLYIASEIARGHGGRLAVASADGETCFTFEMPADG